MACVAAARPLCASKTPVTTSAAPSDLEGVQPLAEQQDGKGDGEDGFEHADERCLGGADPADAGVERLDRDGGGQHADRDQPGPCIAGHLPRERRLADRRGDGDEYEPRPDHHQRRRQERWHLRRLVCPRRPGDRALALPGDTRGEQDVAAVDDGRGDRQDDPKRVHAGLDPADHARGSCGGDPKGQPCPSSLERSPEPHGADGHQGRVDVEQQRHEADGSALHRRVVRGGVTGEYHPEPDHHGRLTRRQPSQRVAARGPREQPAPRQDRPEREAPGKERQPVGPGRVDALRQERPGPVSARGHGDEQDADQLATTHPAEASRRPTALLDGRARPVAGRSGGCHGAGPAGGSTVPDPSG